MAPRKCPGTTLQNESAHCHEEFPCSDWIMPENLKSGMKTPAVCQAGGVKWQLGNRGKFIKEPHGNSPNGSFIIDHAGQPGHEPPEPYCLGLLRPVERKHEQNLKICNLRDEDTRTKDDGPREGVPLPCGIYSPRGRQTFHKEADNDNCDHTTRRKRRMLWGWVSPKGPNLVCLWGSSRAACMWKL